MDADARLLSSLEHNCGPHIMEALRDPSVIEIMLNPDGAIWIERYGQEQECVAHLPLAQGRLILSLVASALGMAVSEKQSIVEGSFRPLSAPEHPFPCARRPTGSSRSRNTLKTA